MAKHKPIDGLTDELRTRLLSQVHKTGIGCWLWLGARNGKGYGVVWAQGARILAHRTFFQMETGIDPGDKLVCHSCDNPSCVNPAHLWLGSDHDNMLDMVAKERGRGPFAGARMANGICVSCDHRRTDDYVDSKGRRRCRNCQRKRDKAAATRSRAAQQISA